MYILYMEGLYNIYIYIYIYIYIIQALLHRHQCTCMCVSIMSLNHDVEFHRHALLYNCNNSIIKSCLLTHTLTR